MANEEQLSVLKQGAQIWNRWRFNNRERIDLSVADLRGFSLSRYAKAEVIDEDLGDDPWGRINLDGVNLRGATLCNSFLEAAVLMNANLSNADFTGAKLVGAFFNGANLSEANLSQADLSSAELDDAIIVDANLSGAELRGSYFSRANLTRATLIKSNLHGASLQGTNLTQAILTSANLSDASFGGTLLADLSLRDANGLESAVHVGPSTIGTDTLIKSQGRIPDAFLRGCGLSDWEVEQAKLYNPDLSNEEIANVQYKIYDLRATQALQIAPLFISYSHTDGNFVDKIERHLNKKGVRFWRDVHDAPAGRLEKVIDRAIRQNPTVLLVLSEHSLSSDWVEHEVRTARGLEKEMGRDVLCPVALDDSWKSSRWPKRVMEQIMEYNILNFSEWKDDSKFDGMFRKLIDGLELFYKG
jgi:uncharacterized protein YjbI with pentapeptide repeats